MKQRLGRWFVMFALATGLAACDSTPSDEEPADDQQVPAAQEVDEQLEEPTGDEAESELVEQARELADLRERIEENPDRVDELLDEAGLTEQQLEELMFEISEDREASRVYAEER